MGRGAGAGSILNFKLHSHWTSLDSPSRSPRVQHHGDRTSVPVALDTTPSSASTFFRLMPFFIVHTPELIRIIMNASCATARILSLAILLLSLAPLGSLYVLFVSMGFQQGRHEETIVELLQKPNVTLEELWNVVLMNQWNDDWVPLPARTAHHVTLVLPWLLSVILGLIVPVSMSLCAMMRQRPQRHPWAGLSREKRKKQMRQAIEDYTVILCEDDRIDTEVQDEPSWWSLPKPGVSEGMAIEEDMRSVAGDCVVCLSGFEAGEKVSWSANEECMHCFHHSCILSWLTRKTNHHHLCPCCRQTFVGETLNLSKH